MSDLTGDPIKSLLLCLGSGGKQQRVARLKAFSPADWTALLQRANEHGVAPLLSWRLGELEGELDIPQEARQALRMSRLQNAGRNIVLFHQLGKVLRAMRGAGVEVIALKGAHLAELIYADRALRSMSDIDLLVRREELGRARQVLEQLGYAPSRRFQTEREAAIHLHLPPYHKPGQAVIELHWNIALPSAPTQVDIEALWSASRLATIEGTPARTLAPEHLLLHLCLHFCQHDFKLGLRHLCDILAVVEAPESGLDWEALSSCAQRWKAGKCAFLTLRLAQALLGAPVPAQALSALQPGDFTPQIEELARGRILNPGKPPPLHPDLAGLWGKRALHSRLRPFLASLFPPVEYIAQRYSLPLNSKRIYLYYLLRLKDLLRQYGWQLALMLRGKQAARQTIQQENLLADWWMSS
ncbi:MAG: nucleotidyltransferase family protein [Anaerolineales bacterium]|nr:nucleotidyltransferase family protein [Anaerolineales bacterium]